MALYVARCIAAVLCAVPPNLSATQWSHLQGLTEFFQGIGHDPFSLVLRFEFSPPTRNRDDAWTPGMNLPYAKAYQVIDPRIFLLLQVATNDDAHTFEHV